jgi:hypothetical protein
LARVRQAESGINIFKEAVSIELKKQNPGQIAISSKNTANKLAENLKLYKKRNESLSIETKSISGTLSSLFLPWTKEYRLREEAGKYLAKAESKFSKLTDLAYKSTKNR